MAVLWVILCLHCFNFALLLSVVYAGLGWLPAPGYLTDVLLGHPELLMMNIMGLLVSAMITVDFTIGPGMFLVRWRPPRREVSWLWVAFLTLCGLVVTQALSTFNYPPAPWWAGNFFALMLDPGLIGFTIILGAHQRFGRPRRAIRLIRTPGIRYVRLLLFSLLQALFWTVLTAMAVNTVIEVLG